MLSNDFKKLLGTLTLLLCSVPAFASHALNGLDTLMYAAVVFAVTVVAFLFALINTHRKSKTLRVITFVLGLPLFIFFFYCFSFSAGWVFGTLFILILLWSLIYKSWRYTEL